MMNPGGSQLLILVNPGGTRWNPGMKSRLIPVVDLGGPKCWILVVDPGRSQQWIPVVDPGGSWWSILVDPSVESW